MKKLISALLCVVLLFSSASALSYGGKSFDPVFSEGYFASDSYEYDSGLALLSLGLALSAFGTRTAEPDEHIRAFLVQELGFEGYASYHYDVPLTDSSDKVAFAVARKELDDGTLLAVALRGGDYGNEWSSNFDTGAQGVYGPYHKGFYLSAASVLPLLCEYMEENGLEPGNVKLWISGYSRSAAVGNLLSLLVRVNGLCLPENVYTYTFATPATAELYFRDTWLDNIFSVINPFDIVPMVPLASWGFGRLGRDMVLPRMAEGGSEARLISALGSIGSRAEYVSFLQGPIMSAVCGDYAELYALADSALGGSTTVEKLLAAAQSGSALLIASQFLAMSAYLSQQPADASAPVRLLRALLPLAQELAVSSSPSPLGAFAGHDPALYIDLLLSGSPSEAEDLLPEAYVPRAAYLLQQWSIGLMRRLSGLCR